MVPLLEYTHCYQNLLEVCINLRYGFFQALPYFTFWRECAKTPYNEWTLMLIEYTWP